MADIQAAMSRLRERGYARLRLKCDACYTLTQQIYQWMRADELLLLDDPSLIRRTTSPSQRD